MRYLSSQINFLLRDRGCSDVVFRDYSSLSSPSVEREYVWRMRYRKFFIRIPFSQVSLLTSIRYASSRETFGKKLIEHRESPLISTK